MARERERRRVARGRRRPDAVPLQDLLPKVLREIAPRGRGQLGQVQRIWRGLVGDALAERARPVGLANGILDVDVSSAAVKYELSTFRADEVLSGLRQQLPGVFLRRIRVRVGR